LPVARRNQIVDSRSSAERLPLTRCTLLYANCNTRGKYCHTDWLNALTRARMMPEQSLLTIPTYAASTLIDDQTAASD
jgi:hypothetical protein